MLSSNKNVPMVLQWGFASDKLGATAWESPNGNGFGQPRMASEATERRIDAAVEDIVREAYAVCRSTMIDNRELLERVKDALMEHETIGNDEIMDLTRTYGVFRRAEEATSDEAVMVPLIKQLALSKISA